MAPDPDDEGTPRFTADEDERPVLVSIASLTFAGSPRALGEDPEHLRLLAATEAELPPILVHRPTMRVIDGRHRVAVARQRGDDRIEARFFHGSEADAFVLAVTSNIAHGLPLSLADRRAAAARIVRTHPLWSDRTVASVAGISARTVADVRTGLGEAARRPARLGRDGRVRAVDGGEGRRAAAELIAEHPGLPLRTVAKRAGISPETARDVRNRLRRGESPVPDRRPRAARPVRPGDELAVANPESAAQRLQAEPALRNSEAGRALLRLLLMHAAETEKWDRIADGIPSHRSGTVADLAWACSKIWEDFADRIEGGAESA